MGTLSPTLCAHGELNPMLFYVVRACVPTWFPLPCMVWAPTLLGTFGRIPICATLHPHGLGPMCGWGPLPPYVWEKECIVFLLHAFHDMCSRAGPLGPDFPYIGLKPEGVVVLGPALRYSLY